MDFRRTNVSRSAWLLITEAVWDVSDEQKCLAEGNADGGEGCRLVAEVEKTRCLDSERKVECDHRREREGDEESKEEWALDQGT